MAAPGAGTPLRADEPLPEFDVVVEDVLAAVRKTTKLIFLCSPGNPTAKSIPLATVDKV